MTISIDNLLVKKNIFNTKGNDDILNRKIIKGNTTNLFNLNFIKYTWAKTLYRVMLSNFWIPEKVDLSKDSLDFKRLSKDEVLAFERIISFLTFLDSIQTTNIPRISDYITAPEISVLLAIQDFQEVIHSQSYAYILESVIPADRRNQVYELWRDDKILLERNKYIAEIYQDFSNSSSLENFSKVIIANYILESLYFYNGFMFFYNLANKNLMLGTSDEIRYINRDEATHVELFKNIIRELNLENDNLIKEKDVHELFSIAVEQEIQWTNHAIGNNILGMDKKNTEKYTKYLANKRIKDLGFKELYPNFNENPYSHLEKLADNKGEDIKSNFFEATVTNYSQSIAIEGWDEI